MHCSQLTAPNPGSQGLSYRHPWYWISAYSLLVIADVISSNFSYTWLVFFFFNFLVILSRFCKRHIPLVMRGTGNLRSYQRMLFLTAISVCLLYPVLSSSAGKFYEILFFKVREFSCIILSRVPFIVFIEWTSFQLPTSYITPCSKAFRLWNDCNFIGVLFFRP